MGSKIYNLYRFFESIFLEYQQGGLRHIIVGSLEKVLLLIIKQSTFAYWRIAPKYYRFRCADDVNNYRCAPDPFKVEWIDPDRIKRRTGRSQPRLNRRLKFGKVTNGDWDINGKKIEATNVYQPAKKRFCGGTAWEDTERVQEKFDKLERGEYRGKYKTRDDILSRYYEFDKLYRQIKNNGYKSQKEIIADSNETNKGLYLDTLDEVTVDIGRNGELLHVDGIHRLTIAKILDIEKIPVVFLVRHKEWMEYRDHLCDYDEPIPEHPDLRDLK